MQLTLYTLLCQMAFLRAKTISVCFGIVFIALVHKDYHTSGNIFYINQDTKGKMVYCSRMKLNNLRLVELASDKLGRKRTE